MNNDNNGLNNGNWHDAAHKFTKGNPGKPKGSSKYKLRDEIRTFLNENWKEFPVWFTSLKPKDKIETMLALMPYAVSRLQSISMTDEEGNEIPTAEIDYTKLSEATLKEILAHTKINHNEPLK